MKRTFAFVALAASMSAIVGATPAQANQTPVCVFNPTFDDYSTGWESSVGFYVDDYCYDPDGDQLTVTNVQWGSGWQVRPYGADIHSIIWDEVIPITISDGENSIQVNFTVNRYAY